MLLLDEERNAASHASDLLEQERKERLRLEKLSKGDFKLFWFVCFESFFTAWFRADLQSNYDEMREKIEVMEVELAEKRLLYSENIPLDSDDDEGKGKNSTEYKLLSRKWLDTFIKQTSSIRLSTKKRIAISTFK